MGKESLEIALIKYNKKTWSKSALLGAIIGLAVIVPGISGSTVAIIFKLYDQFLYAIGNLFKAFKRCFLFLLPIGLGIVVGFLLGLFGVKKLLDIDMFAVVCLFAGLMCGAFPAVKDEIKGMQWNKKRVGLFLLGIAIPVALGCISAIGTIEGGLEASGDNVFNKVKTWQVLLAVVIGFAVGVTQVVPGLSASALLMSVGWYASLMESVSLTYVKSNPSVLLVYGGLGVGFLLGLFVFSKLLTFIFGKSRLTAYTMIVGLSLGSILSMLCNGDIVGVYMEWFSGEKSGGQIALSVGLGVALFAVGSFVSYLLVRFERKKGAQATETEALPSPKTEE